VDLQTHEQLLQKTESIIDKKESIKATDPKTKPIAKDDKKVTK